MKNAKLTVLMPVFNASKFLAEAIESMLNQSFSDFEFLIIDDGSTDNSVDIVKGYKDPRIRLVINDCNMGISATLNKGIRLSNTELIARMDADDISYPQRLEKQFAYMSAHPDCALLSTWAKVVTEDKKFVRLERYRSNFYYYNLTFECWMYHPTIMFRKTPVCDVNMYSMPYSEDYDLFWKISVKYKIWNLTEPLLDYRLSSTSLNTVTRKEEYEQANEQNVLRNLRHYMGPEFTVNKEILECLRHNFQPIVEKNDLNEIIHCLSVLDQITHKILVTNNVNNDQESIRRAHYFKRNFILNELGKQLPVVKALALMIRTQAWLELYSLSKYYFYWKVRLKLRSML